jgi:hypothetical protein
MSAAQFVQDPIVFMSQNIILTDVVSNQEANPGNTDVRRFTLDLCAGAPLTNRNNAAVYRLNDITWPIPRDHLRAYWCPYKPNHQLGVMLEGDARYMFTAVMSGCSLGIGSATQDGSRAVFHANMESAAGRKDPGNPKSVEKAVGRQVNEQNKKLLHMLVPEQNIIDPAFYGGGIDQSVVGSVVAYEVKLKSTTVGLRVDGQWKFYTLRYRRLNGGKSYEHHCLHQFASMV